MEPTVYQCEDCSFRTTRRERVIGHRRATGHHCDRLVTEELADSAAYYDRQARSQ